MAQWLSWLERRPVTAEVVGSNPIRVVFNLKLYIWDHSSAGRASALQAEGHRFEPYWSHTFSKIGCGGIAQLARAHGSYPWCRWFKSSSRYFCANVCGTSCLWQVCCISIYRNTARESEVSGSFLLFNFIYRSIQEKQNRL